MRVFILLTLLLAGVVFGSEIEPLEPSEPLELSEPSEPSEPLEPVDDDRISNGWTAEPGQFTYQVNLKIDFAGNAYGSCGAALIAPNWILTAAHCVEGAKKVTAFLGHTGLQSGLRLSVLETFIHRGWDHVGDDIALLRIPTINFGQYIYPVQLPPLYGFEEDYVNENVIASGWGYLNDENLTPANVLQYARMRVVPNFVCSEVYGPNAFRDSNICVQGESKRSTCKGDSGGPLVTESTRVLIGLTSFGSKRGCTKDLPTAFTRVSSYRQWIREISGV